MSQMPPFEEFRRIAQKIRKLATIESLVETKIDDLQALIRFTCEGFTADLIGDTTLLQFENQGQSAWEIRFRGRPIVTGRIICGKTNLPDPIIATCTATPHNDTGLKTYLVMIGEHEASWRVENPPPNAIGTRTSSSPMDPIDADLDGNWFLQLISNAMDGQLKIYSSPSRS